MIRLLLVLLSIITLLPAAVTSPVVDTGQAQAFAAFDGQDGHYAGAAAAYHDHGDGTVSDLVTGLMWTRDPGAKRIWSEHVAGAERCRVGGHDDWRLPTVHELYSLMDFNGIDPDPQSSDSTGLRPFIDTTAFSFRYGDLEAGERIIDAQYATSTVYVSTTMHGNRTMFGVNFADGRIKGYPIGRGGPRGEKSYYAFYVRDNPAYGTTRLRDNGDGTVTDDASGLTWMRADSGHGMDWPTALAYAENLDLAGHDDWRLPTAKELLTIVDYSRSPDTSDSAAIDPIFAATAITNEGGERDFGQYWTSTTHIASRGTEAAVYVAFGRALGWMDDRRSGEKTLLDVHGAGAQRSDPKVGDAGRFPYGRGPQGDVI
ncbi:MAG: Lcl C-terminal domain-containing protein, partial [Planctomycetota bacterium]